MTLSIIITTLSDSDLPNTLHSIRETAGDLPEVIVVSDSPTFSFQDNTTGYDHLIRNTQRCGVGPSRVIGLQHATGDYVLIIDSHSRFPQGWYEKVIARLEARPKTLTCFEMCGLDSDHMDLNNPK